MENIKGKTDPAVINILVGKLREVVKDFEKFATYDSHEEVNDVISIYRRKYAQNLQNEVSKLLREPEPVEDETPHVAQEPNDHASENTNEGAILQITTSTIVSNQNTKPTPSIPRPSELTTSPIQQTQGTAGAVNKNPIPFPPPPPSVPNTVQKKQGNSGVDSLLQPLINKGIYTPEQLAVLRKVLNTMLLVCPSAKKKNLSVLMQSAIASLE